MTKEICNEKKKISISLVFATTIVLKFYDHDDDDDDDNRRKL